MSGKRVLLIGVGQIIGMVKYFLIEKGGIDLLEILPGCCDELNAILEREQPSVVILEQSDETRGFLERLLMFARDTQLKIVEVNPNDNTINVVKWNEIQLENVQDFLTVLSTV
jgi:hypothetical protein